MATFRIYDTSKIRWDRDIISEGSVKYKNFWNRFQKVTIPPGPSAGRSSYNPTHFKSWEEEQKLLKQPTIIIENLNPNNSPAKQQMMEAAGIKLGFGSVKESRESDPQVTITNISFKYNH